MKYLSVFYSKHILKTPFFLLAYGIIALIFMAFNLALDYGDIEHTNYIVRFDSLAYIEIVLVAIVFCIAAYFAQEKNGLEQMCLYSKAQIEINKIVMTIVCSLSFCSFYYIIRGYRTHGVEIYCAVLGICHNTLGHHNYYHRDNSICFSFDNEKQVGLLFLHSLHCDI